jgi:hypothetical protein
MTRFSVFFEIHKSEIILVAFKAFGEHSEIKCNLCEVGKHMHIGDCILSTTVYRLQVLGRTMLNIEPRGTTSIIHSVYRM